VKEIEGESGKNSCKFSIFATGKSLEPDKAVPAPDAEVIQCSYWPPFQTLLSVADRGKSIRAGVTTSHNRQNLAFRTTTAGT
jgi:hypothetical protein